MIQILFRLLGESAVGWAMFFALGLVGLFAFYVGVALVGVFRAPDAAQAEARYKVFRDLLDLFRRGRR
jgi:hypothetical protein